MDEDQSQGNTAPEVQEKLEEMTQESQTLAERSKTVDERLNQITQTAQEPEPTPSSNQETEPIEEKVALENSKNPERTREYIERLKEENRILKEKARKEAGQSVFDSLRQPQESVDLNMLPGINPQQANQIAQNFVAEDGTVDINGLNNALRLASDRATIAETEARRAREIAQQSEERQQVREAHVSYPELDPQAEKFDPNFYDLVALRLAKDMRANRGRSTMTLAQAAAEVRRSYLPTASVNLEKVKDEAVSQYKDNLQKRNQEPLSSSRGEPRIDVNPDLRDRTRKGDPFALDERLRKLGLIK